MKNLFILSVLLVAPLIASAQLKVNSDGTVCVGRTTSFGSSALRWENNIGNIFGNHEQWVISF